jgi:hypothetical protein
MNSAPVSERGGREGGGAALLNNAATVSGAGAGAEAP